jgi:anti-sigma-K factor RsiG
MTKGGNRRIDRILDPSYIEGLGDLSTEELRSKREECEEEEFVFSYERRLLHARMDLLEAERKRRVAGESPRSLIERLPEILADEDRTHRGAFPNLEAPPIFEHPRRRVEKLIANDMLTRLPDLPDDEITAILGTLKEAERDVSDSRRAVQAVIDRIVEELARRLVDA